MTVQALAQPDYQNYCVDPSASAYSLSVLANDNFGRVYAGPGVITSVTAVGQSEHGATVSIASDGKSVRYTPPKDFVGDDRFSYTVDGGMQAEITVHVIRHVRADHYHVTSVTTADSTSEQLDVLVNDLFSANYQGPRRITSVTSSLHGASISIAHTQSSLLYRPPVGFAGTDTFSYVVDGALIATVSVTVSHDNATLFPKFESLDNFEQFLIDDALVRYRHLFGLQGLRFNNCPVCLGNEDGNTPGVGPGNDVDRDHSTTNVQVDGIDEGDIVEFDADYTYVLNDTGVVIVDAWPAEDLSVVSRIDIEGSPQVEYLRGTRLTVISQTGGGYYGHDLVRGDIAPWPYTLLPFTTHVTVLDVTDRTAPRVVQTTSIEGHYVESRAIGDFVYVATLKDNAVAPAPNLIPNEPIEPSADGTIRPWYSGTYETEEAYLARIRANTGELVDAALPNSTSYGPSGEIVRSGLVNAPEDIFRPIAPSVSNLLSVTAFSVTQNEPGLSTTAGLYAAGAGIVYASHDHFYLFDQGYSAEDGATTLIMKFDWDGETGHVDFVASGAVPGTMLNQFSADERDGYLRVATNILNAGGGDWTGRPQNTLFVLRENLGVFEHVGRLANLAVGETIRSVRFLGEQAVISTFRNVDPLFAIDLSDPRQPRTLGNITLPGYLSYMQRVGTHHLLTVGYNTPDGWNGPTQIALFDISNPRQPRMVDNYTFARFSTSEATIDHHAFGYYAAHGVFALPSSRGYFQRVDKDGDGYRETSEWIREESLFLFDIALSSSADAIQFMAEITHDKSVRRSGYIGDKLYSIGIDAVKSVSLADPQTILASVTIEEPAPVPSTASVPTRYPATLGESDPLQRAIVRARESLASILGAAAGESLVLVAETESGSDGSQSDVVLRVNHQDYHFHVAPSLSTELVDGDYEFPTTNHSGLWHNEQVPADVDQDGYVTWRDVSVIYEQLATSNGSNLTPAVVVRQIGTAASSVHRVVRATSIRELVHHAQQVRPRQRARPTEN